MKAYRSENRVVLSSLFTVLVLFFAACGEDDKAVGKDPASAPKASVDRFSATAAALMVRTPSNGLPAANAPIDFDKAPFITEGLGPSGERVQYYNFDVRPDLLG